MRLGNAALSGTALRPDGKWLAAGAQQDASSLDWDQWQRSVLTLLSADLIGVMGTIGSDEVDWEAWRCFYEAGRTPRQAVNRALERDW